MHGSWQRSLPPAFNPGVYAVDARPPDRFARAYSKL
jgi:hypothetical protein